MPNMDFAWLDYVPETMQYIENWLDEAAVRSTGLDDGFFSFYEYWANEDGFIVGTNYWCKVVSANGAPFAVIAFCLHEGKVIIQEMVICPESRGKGMGTKLLKELLENEEILGFSIQKSESVIFASNTASQRAFEKAGFKCIRTDESGNAMHYAYESDYYGIQ